MREVEELMTECRDEGLYVEFLPGQIISHLCLDDVDGYMASLPSDFREVAVDHVQVTYASGQERFRLLEATPEFVARESALREWVARVGRLHCPRHANEPDMAAIVSRLKMLRPKWRVDPSRVVKRPWKLLQWAMGQNLEQVLNDLPPNAANAIAEWARGVKRYQDKWHSEPSELPAADREVLEKWLETRRAEGDRGASQSGEVLGGRVHAVAQSEAVAHRTRRSADAFVQSLPSGSPEREYHEALVRVVSRVAFDDSSEVIGFGLMNVLTDGRLVTDEIDTGAHPVAGSVDENSHLVSSLFGGVARAPAWWKVSYGVRRSAPEVVAAARWWCQVLRADAAVINVEPY